MVAEQERDCGAWEVSELACKIAAMAIAAIVAIVIGVNTYQHITPPQPPLSPHVKIVLNNEHGSGVHIGDGLILTAAHVTDGATTATLKTDNGAVRDAEVLWSSGKYDVALLATSPRDLQVLDLSCLEPAEGTPITAHGNPFDLEGVQSWGRVVNASYDQHVLPGTYMMNITIITGMSGGAVVDESGRVVGIVSHLLASNMFGVRSPTGFAFAVSGSSICELMGRT